MSIFKREILRSAEGESGGSDTSQSEDRTAKLEERLARMGTALETVLARTGQTERSVEERRYAEAEGKLDSALNDATKAVDDAETKLAAAYDEGDGVTIARAQRSLSEAAAKRERMSTEVEMARARLKEAREKKPSQPTQEKADTTNLTAWKSRHSSWYGTDDDMTKAAHDIDRNIRNLGVIPAGSKEYFDAIDRQMRARFPDRMGGSPPGQSMSNGGGGTNRSDGGSTRIPADVAESYARMGFNMKDPDTVKRLVSARETAVQKGLVPERPTGGRIFTR